MTDNKGQAIKKYKIVFLGDQSVGKTSIINRFIYDSFIGNEQPTVGIDFVSKTLNIENKTLRLQLWDTAGQERFHSLIPSYIRDSHAAIIIYDCTNLQSFQNTSKWIDDVKEERGSDVIIYMIANKIDLESERKVSTQEGSNKAKEYGATFFQEVSAAQGTNVAKFFEQLSHKLIGDEASETNTGNQTNQPNQDKKQSGGGVVLSKVENGDKNKKSKGCC